MSLKASYLQVEILRNTNGIIRDLSVDQIERNRITVAIWYLYDYKSISHKVNIFKAITYRKMLFGRATSCLSQAGTQVGEGPLAGRSSSWYAKPTISLIPCLILLGCDLGWWASHDPLRQSQDQIINTIFWLLAPPDAGFEEAMMLESHWPPRGVFGLQPARHQDPRPRPRGPQGCLQPRVSGIYFFPKWLPEVTPAQEATWLQSVHSLSWEISRAVPRPLQRKDLLEAALFGGSL